MASEGRGLESLAEAKTLVKQLNEIGDPTAIEQALWLGASSHIVKTAALAGQPERAVAQLRECTKELEAPAWQQWADRTSDYYSRMIHLNVAFGQMAEALDLFEIGREHVTLDAELRRDLAVAAARLGRTDLGAAQLYLDGLAAEGFDTGTRIELADLLRRAIRIGLVSPEDALLAAHCQLNERAWKAEAPAWSAAHLAMAAIRQRRWPDALAWRDRVRDLETSDADALQSLGTASYLNRRWDDALTLFGMAIEGAPADVNTLKSYSGLTEINLILSSPETIADRQTFRSTLEAKVAAITQATGAGAIDLDAAWVAGSALATLGRGAEALAAFEQAPPAYLTWNHAQSYVTALARAGRLAEIPLRLKEMQEHVPDAAGLVRQLSAKQALDRSDFAGCAELVETTGLRAAQPAGLGFDADAVAACLQHELALSAATPAPPLPPLPHAETVSAAVRAWHDRLRCRWHLARAEADEAGAILAGPLQWLDAGPETRRLEAVLMTLPGRDPAVAADLFARLAQADGAQPIDQLHWGFWLCGQGRHAEASNVLRPLGDALPDCLERTIALAECLLAAGDAPGAREVLGKLAHLDVVTNRRNIALFRPWQERVPIRAWANQAAVAMARVGDLLHMAFLLIRAGDVPAALRAAAMVDELLGDSRISIAEEMGRIYETAATTEVRAERLDEACTLAIRAGEYSAATTDFAVILAEALEQSAEASDLCFRVLHGWVVKFAGGDQALGAGPIGRALVRHLRIDGQNPQSPTEVDRRVRWTRAVVEARPRWNWPQRNLARAAARSGRFDEVADLLRAIEAPTGEDHLLLGRACWELGRFEDAVTAFSRSVDAGHELPTSQAWRACARAASRFEQQSEKPWPWEANVFDEVLPELDPSAAPEPLAPLVQSWRGAVLIVVGRADLAAEVLEVPTGDDDLRESSLLLRGYALTLTGRAHEAIEIWRDDIDDPARRHTLRQGVRLLIQTQHAPLGTYGELAAEMKQARKLGADDEVFHLVVAQLALRQCDRTEAAAAATVAAAARRRGPWPILLAPLWARLRVEHDFVSARLAMHDGRFDVAAGALEQIEPVRLAPLEARYWRAIALLGAGRITEGTERLRSLLEFKPVGADAASQLALQAVRDARIDEAELFACIALETNPGNAFALLAMAEIHAARGDRGASRAAYQRVIEQDSKNIGKRAATSAMLALGRLELLDGNSADAERLFRQAVATEFLQCPARLHLGLLLTTAATAPARLQEAEELLAASAVEAPEDVRIPLARALVAARLGRHADAAGRLGEAIAHAGFGALPSSSKRTIALWAADIQTAQGRVDEAVLALEALAAEDPSEAVAERLARCRLLKVGRFLNTVPFPSGGLEHVLADVEAIRSARPDEPLAILLATACRLLLGRGGEPETGELAARAQTIEPADGVERALSFAVRRLLGEKQGSDGQPDLGEELVRGVDLLVANLDGDADALEREANQLVRATDDGLAASPLAPSNTVLVAALNRIARKESDAAADLLEFWHGRGRGIPESRMVHSKILAKRAVKHLRLKKLGESRGLLAAALGFATTGQEKGT
jgi:tetratricopeptide (TPR) repeat protein